MLPCGFMIGVLVFLVGFVAAQAAALRYWRGSWQVAALVPAAIVLFVVLRIVVDVLLDPTSHNLWPFEIIIWGGVGLGLLGVMAAVRALCTPRVGGS